MDDVRLKRAVANTGMSERGSQLDLRNVPFTTFPHYRELH